jgi:hypothetical protein
MGLQLPHYLRAERDIMAIATDSKESKGFGSAVTNEWETPDFINAQKRLDKVALSI